MLRANKRLTCIFAVAAAVRSGRILCRRTTVLQLAYGSARFSAELEIPVSTGPIQATVVGARALEGKHTLPGISQCTIEGVVP